jgi:hypothetical protein
MVGAESFDVVVLPTQVKPTLQTGDLHHGLTPLVTAEGPANPTHLDVPGYINVDRRARQILVVTTPSFARRYLTRWARC